MIELFMEGQRVDVNEAFSTMLSFAIDDVRDFAAKSTTVSKTVILPGTNNNNKLFGNIFDASSSNDYNPALPNKGINFNASVSASVVVFNDNFQVMKGIMQMLEIIIDDGMIEYEVGLFGELGGFIAKLGNLKLEDLDFSAYDHTYSLANITGSWSSTGSTGYVYPLIDYGTYSTLKNNWSYKTFRPALFAWEYWNKIIANSGYTYQSDLIDSARFRNLIIPHSRKKLERKSSSQLDIYADFQNPSLDDAVPVLITLPTQPTLGGFTASAGNTKFTYAGATITGKLTVTFDLEVQNSSTNGGGVSVRKNGTDILGILAIYPSTDTTLASSVTLNNLSIASGDYLEVVALISGGDTTTAFLTVNSLNLNFGNTGQGYVEVNLGETITINDTIPKNILQKDFISSIVKLFQLYIFEDPTQDKVLMIAPFVDFFNLATSIDWSNKLHRGKPIKLKPMSELNARYYEFNFKKDSDYYNDLYEKRYNETYGSYKYDSAYEFAKETEKIELIFSGTPLVGYDGQEKVYSSIYKKNNDVEENVDSNIRLLQIKLITGVASWDILNGATVLGSYTNYLYAGHLDDPDAPSNDIQFGVPKELFFTLVSGALNVNQFNIYWSSYMAEITDKDSRLLSGTFKLSYKDIANLDFSKLIYIDGSLYRLNKIEDFNATREDVTSCSLIKVINKIY